MCSKTIQRIEAGMLQSLIRSLSNRQNCRRIILAIRCRRVDELSNYTFISGPSTTKSEDLLLQDSSALVAVSRGTCLLISSLELYLEGCLKVANCFCLDVDSWPDSQWVQRFWRGILLRSWQNFEKRWWEILICAHMETYSKGALHRRYSLRSKWSLD